MPAKKAFFLVVLTTAGKREASGKVVTGNGGVITFPGDMGVSEGTPVMVAGGAGEDIFTCRDTDDNGGVPGVS